MKHRFFAVLLVLMLALSLLTPALADNRTTSGQCGDHAYWRVDTGSKTLYITGTGAVDIYRYGMDVSAQSSTPPWWYFQCNSDIYHIRVGEGITAILGNAFEMTGFVQTISLPSTLTELEGDVFAHCGDGSVELVVPDAVTWLDGKVFSNSGFRSVRLGAGVRTLGKNLFSESAVQTVTLPAGVHEIGDGAFSSCDQLQNIDLSRVETIGDGAFYRCDSLEEANLRSAKTIGRQAFKLSGVKRVTFSGELGKIEAATFAQTKLEQAYINGTAAARDRLRANIVREGNDPLLALTIQPVTLPPLSPADQTPVVTPFRDVAASRWSAAAITKLSGAGIIYGYGDRIFLPENPVTRAEFCVMLNRMLPDGLPPTSPKSFRDVAQGDWYCIAVWNLASIGAVNGVGDDLFLPDAPITRQDMATIISRMLAAYRLNLPAKNAPMAFLDDASIADYAAAGVSQMQRIGVIRGFEDGTFRPEANATREETAQMLCNLLTAMGR